MNINQVWPEWNEDCVLGEGSFGKVYRAKRVEYGRTFYSAIKVLTVPKTQQEIRHARAQGMNDTEIYDYFRGLVDNLLNEITLMDNLKGAQNIVGIEDYKIIEHEGEIGWDIFIRMELLTPFDSFVSNPEFSQLDVIRLGVDICTALEVCEQNYIVHRDIKPDNIFISRFGEYKLGDFGIARKMEANQANLSRKGTLNFMAPEVYKSEEYGPNVDIYSLGLVLYTLLNNNRVAFLPPYPQPISYKDNEEALTKRLSGVALSPPCNASASLSAVIIKACSYSKQDRYQTAMEFKNALIAEWNTLVQSGANREIGSDAMRFSGNMEQRLQHTTNDMTAHGRLLVGEYDQGTTVLAESDRNGENAYYGHSDTIHSAEMNMCLPTSYQNNRSQKVCRILARLMAFAVCGFAVVLLLRDEITAVEQLISTSLLVIGLTILLADTNRIAVGVSALALSLPYIITGTAGFIGGLQSAFPVAAVIFLLCGLLILSGGIVISTQKEVKFGGSLCVYAFAIERLFFLYQRINHSHTLESWHMFYGVAAVAMLVWAYGYQSDSSIKGFRKVRHTGAYILAAAIAVRAILFAVTSFADIF